MQSPGRFLTEQSIARRMGTLARLFFFFFFFPSSYVDKLIIYNR